MNVLTKFLFISLISLTSTSVVTAGLAESCFELNFDDNDFREIANDINDYWLKSQCNNLTINNVYELIFYINQHKQKFQKLPSTAVNALALYVVNNGRKLSDSPDLKQRLHKTFKRINSSDRVVQSAKFTLEND